MDCCHDKNCPPYLPGITQCCRLSAQMVADHIPQCAFHCLTAPGYGNDQISLSARSFFFLCGFRNIRIRFLKQVADFLLLSYDSHLRLCFLSLYEKSGLSYQSNIFLYISSYKIIQKDPAARFPFLPLRLPGNVLLHSETKASHFLFLMFPFASPSMSFRVARVFHSPACQ